MAQRIHIIFKTHLDVGFTDMAASIRKQYFDRFIPNALALARRSRETDSPNRFIWTTGSWLIFEYLENADAKARREMENGVSFHQDGEKAVCQSTAKGSTETA